IPGSGRARRTTGTGLAALREPWLRRDVSFELDAVAEAGEDVAIAEDLAQCLECRLSRAVTGRDAVHLPIIVKRLRDAANLGLLREHEVQPAEDPSDPVFDGPGRLEDLLDSRV